MPEEPEKRVDAPAAPEEAPDSAAPPAKKQRGLRKSDALLSSLPDQGHYERSFLHKDSVFSTLVTPKTEYVVSTGKDGVIKIYKKMPSGIEFIKSYRAHRSGITGVSCSPDGTKLCTISSEPSVKVFDILSYDMCNIVSLPFVPLSVCWVCIQDRQYLAVSESDGSKIHIVDHEGSGEILSSIVVHNAPVSLMAYNTVHHTYYCVKGALICAVRYWSMKDYHFPKEEVSFSRKYETDLYDLMTSESTPQGLCVSPDGELFAIVSNDYRVRVFNFRSGKKYREYDESPEKYDSQQKAGEMSLDPLELGRRKAVMRELRVSYLLGGRLIRVQGLSPSQVCNNAVFDWSSQFLLYSSLLGVKVVNLLDDRLERVIGSEVNDRYLGLSLFQGIAKKDSQVNLDGSTTVPNSEPMSDPTLFCAAYKSRSFFLYTRRSPDEHVMEEEMHRNEAEREEEEAAAAAEESQNQSTKKEVTGTRAMIHTTVGDMEFEMYPKKTPKTNTNFCTHAKNGYYDGILFHRVIKGFMVQTGDPLGNGTGGESIFGGFFEDEFRSDLKHDSAGVMAMANRGPCTNGSQFFITCAPAPWLDQKHTVFGKLIRGDTILRAIENAKTNTHDKPLEDIRIVSIDIFSK